MKKHWLDQQHRGFGAYRQEIGENNPQWSRAAMEQSNGTQMLDAVLTDCEVDTDWIAMIEQTLPFVEDAVRQSRQFILRQGETVPIEKVKQVSRASVEHLSRHSQLITTVPKPEEPLIPEKLYVTENVGTYAIYENRFLYMLLCRVRDFVGVRYRGILDATGFFGNISLEKKYTDANRMVEVSLQYKEISHDPEETANDAAAAAMARIREILQTVETLLRTELMQEAAQAPLLRQPVVRTNVMLHDRNFKAAFELYTFLEGYWETGYRVIERFREQGPFGSRMQKDMADWLALTAYLPYRAGMYASLEERYLAEEQQRLSEELLQRQRELEMLRSRIGTEEGAEIAYMIALEKSNAQLQKRALMFEEEETRHQKTREYLADAQKQNRRNEAQIQTMEMQMQEQKQQMQSLEEEHARAAAQQKAEQQRLEAALAQQEQKFHREYADLMERYQLAKARNHAAGQMEENEEFVSREGFAALETEFKAFQKFYEQQWKQAKKRIRKEQLWKK